MNYSENYRASNEGAQQLCRIQQQTELRLGSSTEKADGDSNTFTVDGFKVVLRALKTKLKLTTLDMQLPHLKELNFSGMNIYLLFN
jgi:hypothetical protein